MSALGNYIHLMAKNYQQYGVNRINSGQSSLYNYMSAHEFLNNRLNEVHSFNQSQQVINTLKQRLLANSSQNINQVQSQWKKERQKLINKIYEILYERSKTVTGAKKQLNMAAGNGWRTSNGEKQQISFNENWASTDTHESLMKKRVKAQNYYREIQKLITKINQNSQPQSDKDFQKLLQLYQNYTHLIPKEGATVAEIDKAIGEKRFGKAASNIYGAFGEMLVATCDDTASTLAENEVFNFLDKAVVGDQRSEIIITRDKVYGDKFLNTSTQTEEASYTLGSTQDKVDVIIKVKDEDVFANVKAYSYKDGKPNKPKLQQVNLFSTIIYLNQTLVNFGNHWLNMHAKHTDIINWPNITEADNLVQKEVLFQAISSGNPLKGAQNANLFVYINRATGEVFVETISNLLLNQIDRFRTNKDIASIHFENSFQPNIGTRITNVLSQLHKAKIKVSLQIFN